jgi:hypothetical protein
VDHLFTVSHDETPWDHTLAHVMTELGSPTYEEALFPELLEDLAQGYPRELIPCGVSEVGAWVADQRPRWLGIIPKCRRGCCT